MKIIRPLSLIAAALIIGCTANSEVKEAEIAPVALTQMQL